MTETTIIPRLPKSASLDPSLGQHACSWLDDYIAFSRKWSPRSYCGFHVACGLWLLSTVAGRRVVLHLGKARYTPLFILLAARTSLYAKSSAVEIGIDLLHKAGLDYFLAADAATPQKFIQDLTLRVPDDFEQWPSQRRERHLKRLAFAAQRGWFYEEFGQHVHAMNRKDGYMADFKGIIRRFDDCPERYEYGTISRGTDVVERPYLALLGSLTPADLRPFAKKGDAMWNDGFWARFAFVTPPPSSRQEGCFPPGERVIPRTLIQPLVDWHTRLGVPTVRISELADAEGKSSGQKRAECDVIAPSLCTLGPGVYDAFYRYFNALTALVNRSEDTDLDGNYVRFAEKALRVAMLFASLENNGVIEMRHWARAQQIAEGWRAGLHALYAQINAPAPSKAERHEEYALAAISRHGPMTAAQVAAYVNGLNTAGALLLLENLVEAKVLEKHLGTRATHYDFPH